VAERIETRVSSLEDLRVRENSYGAVVAIGLLEWVPDVHAALARMAGFVAPGGHVLANVDNAWAIHCLLDPKHHPLLAPLKRATVAALEFSGLQRRRAHSSRCAPWRLQRAFRHAGLEPLSRISGGFGPITFLGKRLLPERAGLRLHHRLQDWADSGVPVLCAAGETYLVLARKPESAR
jgi:SAM-dependent methyltransferase